LTKNIRVRPAAGAVVEENKHSQVVHVKEEVGEEEESELNILKMDVEE
jgi:hypothetical protein